MEAMDLAAVDDHDEDLLASFNPIQGRVGEGGGAHCAPPPPPGKLFKISQERLELQS